MRNTNPNYWKLQLSEGIVLVLLGLSTVFVPLGLDIAFLVWLLLFGGIAGLITTMAMRTAAGFWWSLMSAVLAIGIAVLAFATPELMLTAFPFLLMIFLIAEGAITVMFALEHWREHSARWNWMLASGVVDLCLALFLIFGLPRTADWILGLILAVNLIFGGGALIGMALVARDQQRAAAS